MKIPHVSSGTAWKRLLAVGLGGVVAWWLYSSIKERANRDDFIPVDLSGMHHIGPNFKIAPFVLNGTYGFNVGREGGGGSDVCCVLLPRQWRPGLSVDLRWAVARLKREESTDKVRPKYKTVSFECFRATVPVEKYEAPGRVVAHFFTGGKARVVVGSPGPAELSHADLAPDSRAADIATLGQQADDLFTKEEYDMMRRRKDEQQRKHGGEWR